MTIQIAIVLVLLVLCVVLFAIESIPPDVTALGLVLALIFTKILKPEAAFAGFGSETVIMIFGLLLLTAALMRTGVMDLARGTILRFTGTSPLRLLVVIMVASATIGAFMSNTASTAFFVPVVIGLANRAKISPSKLLLPLAFSSILTSSVTLISTSTNIVIFAPRLDVRMVSPTNGQFFAFSPTNILLTARAINYFGGNVTSVVVTCSSSSGGSSGLSVQYLGTDASGVQTYQMTSPDNGPGPEYLRVLQPDNPAAGVTHNFIYVLPVEAGESDTFGDGLQVIQSLNLQNQYNLTVIEPSFGIDPWYADNPLVSTSQEDTFMATDLQPWVTANLGTTGAEQHWLIGFSKSGIGGQTLILRHPDKFTLAASWDFPADMVAYDQFGGSSTPSYGTDANFQANYRLTPAFLSAHAAPFQASNRIWIGGYQIFQQDMADYDALLTAQGIKHTTEAPTAMEHRWDSGWVPIALAALHADSGNIH